MGDFRNCKVCGKFFTSYGSKICSECMEVEEQEFKAVRDFIYDNAGVNMKQVSEEMNVPLEKIMKWLREERLILKLEDLDDGFDVGLNCEKCGKTIKTGRFCDSCKSNIHNSLTKEFGLDKQKPDDDSEKVKQERMFTAQRRR